MTTNEQSQIRAEQDNVEDSVLQQLVSADQGELLNMTDKLRGFGISAGLSLPLPQIIVCGIQSSGKSSVLEAISGRPFPKGDGVCTTFATELALRRGASSRVSVHIKPAKTRSESECEQLANFAPPATENFETTVEKAKKCLKSHGQTLGVITKPDTLLSGSKKEERFVKCAKNEEHHLDLGWHVVKNRSREVQAGSNLSVRNKEEDDFFAQGIWRESLKPEQLGINALRSRLSSLLEQKTRPELPRILSSIKKSLSECEGELAKLKEPRTMPDEQRKYLIEISGAFQNIIQQAVNGSYTDRSFFSRPTSNVDPIYFRAAIRNLNDGFASIMRQYGHSKEFIDNASGESRVEDLAENSVGTSSPESAHYFVDPPEEISISEYVSEIEELSKRMRGGEQPGLPNHRVIAQLFRSQSDRWESIATQHIDKVSQVSQETFELIASHVASEETASLLRRHLIAQEMVAMHSQAMRTLKMLLGPYNRELHVSRFLLDYMLAYYKVSTTNLQHAR